MLNTLHGMMQRAMVNNFQGERCDPVLEKNGWLGDANVSLGCLMMSGTIGAYIASNEALSGMSVMYFLVIACAGINFLVEFAINVIASPVIFRVSEIVARVSRRSSSGAESEQSSADNAIESVRNCPECGAKIVVQGNVSECPYCGAPVQREGKSAEPNPVQAALPAREKPEK